jgi:ABC-type branched-subunit amino acid transport system substrate-binding protein
MRVEECGRVARRRIGTGREFRQPRVFVVVASLFVFQFACAFSGFSPPSVPPEQRAAYDAAMGNLPANPSAATAGLEAFIATYPRSLLADDASEQLAQLAFAEGRQEEGIRWLAQILSRYPTSDRAAAARLRLAQLEYARDRREAARRLLEPLDLRKLARSEQRAALRLRIALARTPVERMEQLSLLRARLLEEADEREDDAVSSARLDARIETVDRDIAGLISSAASAELEEMIRSLRRRPPSSAIGIELSRRALDAGQLDLASRRIKRAESLARDELDQGQLRLLTERLLLLLEAAEAEAELPPLRELASRARPRTEGARGTVGVVLPLSGDFGAFGQESLRGILLAADLFSGDDEDVALLAGYPDEGLASDEKDWTSRARDIRLVVRDTEGDPVKAAAAIRELAANPSIIAIVGPIFSAESLGAAEAAERTGVPLVTLSTKEEVAAGRSQVFRTRTTPGDEVGVLVAHAFDELEAKRFAVLYPETRYGRGMRKLYWDAVMARGGKMVAASSYDPKATDFSQAMRDMIGYRFLTDLEHKALAERRKILRAARVLEPEVAALLRDAAYSILGPEVEPLPPIVDFDVLFIPDASEKIALIAPGLAFHEISDIRLLGSNDWLDPELLRVARRHVAGSVISTPFYAESDVPFVAEFVERYRNTFGVAPGAYAAQAFDATNLILVQLASGRDHRSGLREGLLDTRAYPGATGVLTMRPDGNARRRPFLLGVSGRRFRSLD